MDNLMLAVGVALVLLGLWDVFRSLTARRESVRDADRSAELTNGPEKELRLVGSIASGCLGVVFIVVALHPLAPNLLAVVAIFFYVVLSAGIHLRRIGA